MSRIRQIRAREIFDSRGNPTVEADVLLEDGSFGRASVPSGKSTGRYEALELRDGDQSRLRGRGVLKAIGHVHDDIAPALIGHDIFDQRGIDSLMIDLDGTENKSKLGANAILSVSLAAARAASDCSGKPLYSYLGGDDAVTIPVPLLNIINGGAHADNALDIQEFMIVPAGFGTYEEAFFAGVVIYRTLKQVLVDHGFSTNVGDEGGFAPALSSDSAALDFLAEAVGKTQYKLGEQIFFALDCAASEYYKDGRYQLVGEDLSLDSQGLSQWYGDLVARFPIISIEDPFAEDDWDATASFTKSLGGKLQIVGDDLLVTNLTRLQRAIDEQTCNSILIKVNQIGTLSESMDAVSLAHKSGFSAIISHRSGETEDNFISHLAVARTAGQLKSGAPCRTDRICKYNELLRISESLDGRAVYAGRSILRQQS